MKIADATALFKSKELITHERNRVGQVWLARSDSNEEYEPYLVVDRKSYIEFEVFGWLLVSLDERQNRFGAFESQFGAIERGSKDMWLLERLS